MQTALRILVVEDDKYFLAHLREILSAFGPVETALDGPTGAALLAAHRYDVVVTDIHLGEGPAGLEMLDLAQAQGALRLVITSSTDPAIIQAAYQRGAQHVLGKAHAHETVPAYLQGLLHQRHAKALDDIFRHRFPTAHAPLREQVRRLFATPWRDRALLLTGATGTGKSVLGKLVASAVYGDDVPFVHLNCSEIPDNLLESELFGHEKGAFTGAQERRVGKLKLADGGVLFLDEVGTMSAAMQQKLLKALEEKTFYPVGATRPEKSRFTLIAATCEDLPRKIAAGLFREDLYFRIAGLSVHLPPLRERPEDVPLLAGFFQAASPRKYVLLPAALEALAAHAWPGNLRELRQALMNLADGGEGVVDATHVRALLGGAGPSPRSTEQGLVNDEVRRYVAEHGLRGYFHHVEGELAREALQRHQGKITSCFRDLKISSSAFYRILHAHRMG
jgi:DNA-binding NtrC family response regulator